MRARFFCNSSARSGARLDAGSRDGAALSAATVLRDCFPFLHEGAAMEPRSAEQSSGTGKPIEKSADEAREGVVGHNVRYVLVFGLVGVSVAFAIVYGYFFAH
jgi:hypothetical protein